MPALIVAAPTVALPAGAYTVDGADVTDLDLAAVRELVAIVDDEPHDGAVGRIEDGDRHHVDVVALEERRELVQATDAVFHKDRKLLHRIGGDECVGIVHGCGARP
ncbi:MAG: hypothetical protein CFE26_26795 [Verrucomicrobiales bacterium VVV1]|nr:MAG: hypothetical protein CFE26_26795 [Verrucomicrobiales bacterium VVV1]